MDSNYTPEFAARPAGPTTLTMPSGATISIGDVYYTLFRHKWKIIICALLGFAAAGAIFKFFPRQYASQARLFIRYVQEENKPIATSEGVVRSMAGRGENILGAEIAIITSLDLAQRAADAFGVEKIVDSKGDSANPRLAAAAQVNKGLSIDAPKSTPVLELTFTHERPEIVQPILATIIDAYLKRHLEIHRPGATFDDAFVQQTEQLKALLQQTEEDLLKARTKAGIISLQDSKRTLGDRINTLRNGILVAEAEIAERQALLKRLEGNTDAKGGAGEESGKDSTAVDLASLPLAEYQSSVERYNLLVARERELSLLFTPESPRLKEVMAQVKEAKQRKTDLESAHPGLLRAPQPSSINSRTALSPQSIDPFVESARIAALGTKIEIMKSQLEQVRLEASNVDKAELLIQELERRKTLQETNYRYFSATLEQTRINEALGAGRVTNITEVQAPSPPAPVRNKSIQFAAGAAVGGIVLGIAWAFLIELFLDRTIKRPIDVRRQAGLNLFLSIPYFKKRKRMKAGASAAALPSASESSTATSGNASNEIAPWDPEQDMHAYFDTLRDRVIGFFESENLTHKPKLIALAGVGKNGGDADVAAGLASSFSETEAGNVLFVDMTTGQGSTQQFFKGEAVNSIDEALSSKEKAQVHDKLFVVSEIGKGDKLPRALPMRFNHIIPKLKASDFDYIIFNMPSVSQISITPRLASYMDVILLVIESEKTDRDQVREAAALLAQSNVHVGAILNNTRTHVPKALNVEHPDNV